MAENNNGFCLTREDAYMLYAQITPTNQWASRKKYLESLTDEELTVQFNEDFGNPQSTKELMNTQSELRKQSGMFARESGLTQEYAHEPDQELIDYINVHLATQHPDDYIELDKEADIVLHELWHKDDLQGIPSDIFFDQNIPLPDCEIVLDLGSPMRYRVCIFEDELMTDHKKDDPRLSILIGAIVLYETDGRIVIPLYVHCGHDYFGCSNIYTIGCSENKKKYWAHTTMSNLITLVSLVLGAWYSIQIALLHPTVKEVFVNPQRVEAHTQTNNINHRKKKRKTKYVRKHMLNAEDIEAHKYITTTNGKFVRRTLAWRVIGHWRHLKNGKISFVHPYWKGPERETKKSSELRERKLEVNTNME